MYKQTTSKSVQLSYDYTPLCIMLDILCIADMISALIWRSVMSGIHVNDGY